MTVIKNEDITQKNFLDDAIASTKLFDRQLQALEDTTKLLGEQFSKTLGNLDLSKTKDIDKLEKILLTQVKLEKQLIDTQKERKKNKKELAFLTDNQVKANLKFQKAQKTQKKLLEAELTLQEKQVSTLADLREQNKALRVSRDQLDFKAQADDVRKLNEQINENNELIEGNVDKLTQQKIGIGRYSEGVQSALGVTENFGQEFSNVNNTLTTGLGLFEGARDLFDKWKNSGEDLNQNLSKTRRRILLIGKAIKAIGIGLLLAAVAALGSAFATSREGALSLQKAIANVTGFVKVLIASLADVANDLVDFFQKLPTIIPGLIKLTLLKVKKEFLNFDIIDLLIPAPGFVKDKIRDALGIKKGDIGLGAVFKEELEETEKELDSLLASLNIFQRRGFDDFGKRVKETTEALIDLAIATDANVDAVNRLRLSVAKLTADEERLLAIEGDATRAFRERKEATLEAIELNDKLSAKRILLAQAELTLINKQIKAELEAAGVSTKRLNLNKLSQDSNLTRLISIELLNQQTDALVGLTEAQSENALSQISNTQILRQLSQDILELDLDLLLDGFDNQKTINERRLQDDRVTLEEKKKILDQTLKDQESFIDNSQKVFNQEVDTKFESLGLTREEADLIKEQVDLRELVKTLNEDGSKALQEQVRELEGSEILETRILEFVREINTFRQDNVDSLRDLNEETKAQENILIEIAAQEREIALLKTLANDSSLSASKKLKLLDEERKKITEEQLEAEIELLTRRKENAEKLSPEFLQIERDLNDKILQLTDIRLKKEEEKEKESLERKKKLLEDFASISKAISDKIFEKRFADIDREANAVSQRQAELVAQIAAGNDEAGDSLTALTKREAELRLQREKEAARQKRVEFALAAVKAYSANLDQDPDSALTDTLGDINVLVAAIGALQGFYKGSEHIASDMGKPSLQGRDGYVVRVDGGERVMTSAQNAMIPRSMTNDTAAKVLHDYAYGNIGGVPEFVQGKSTSQVRVVNNPVDSYAMGAGIGQNMPVTELQVDKQMELVGVAVKIGNKRETNMKRAKTLIS